MAIVFDMSSGKIDSENTGVTSVSDHFELPENCPALQEVCATYADPAQSEAYLNHIRELLKKL